MRKRCFKLTTRAAEGVFSQIWLLICICVNHIIVHFCWNMSVLIKSSVIFFPPNPSAGQSKATEAPDRVGEGEELLFLNRAETPFMGQSLGFSHLTCVVNTILFSIELPFYCRAMDQTEIVWTKNNRFFASSSQANNCICNRNRFSKSFQKTICSIRRSSQVKGQGGVIILFL